MARAASAGENGEHDASLARNLQWPVQATGENLSELRMQPTGAFGFKHAHILCKASRVRIS